VWNRSPQKSVPLVQAGATVSATPAVLASSVEAVITILTDAAAIEAVYHAPDGLLAGDVAGKLFIEMSTVRPATAIALADTVRAKGAALVECPVSGTIGPARNGQLVGLMGAAPTDAARAQPILAQLTRRLDHCGPVGAGSTVKLAINLPLMISWQAFGEAFALCRDLGISPEKLVGLFTDVSASTNAIKARAAMVVALLAGNDPGGVTVTVETAAKDLRNMAAEGRAHGLELPLTERALACFEEAARNGYAPEDAATLAAYWSKRGAR
jgi:3-hydroxyisobutyrate dehydrogenase